LDCHDGLTENDDQRLTFPPVRQFTPREEHETVAPKKSLVLQCQIFHFVRPFVVGRLECFFGLQCISSRTRQTVWSPYLVHIDKVSGLPPIGRDSLDMLADDVVDEPHSIFRGCINVSLTNEQIGTRITVEQDVWNPERAFPRLPRRSCDRFSATHGGKPKN